MARPRAGLDEVRATWVGHATLLLQVGPWNLLTDPIFSRRATPVPGTGPARFTPPGLVVDALPPLDAVLLTHDHFDHLDRPSVLALRDRYGPELTWITPLGYRGWFARLGIHGVRELDWWEAVTLQGPDGAVTVTAAPARHWTRRRWRVNRRLWASWAVRTEGGRAVYFGGDSGFFPGYPEIGRRLGPFELVIMPVGAYEPRWFMRGAHMNPEEAVRAYREMGGQGVFIGMHWGTFRLTDEDPLEPPRRARAAWTEAELPEGRLALPGIGGTVRVGAGGDALV